MSKATFRHLGCALVLAAHAFGGQETEEATATPAAPSYVLQVGDVIEVRAFENEEISDTVQIRPDGKISMVLVDDVEAAGLTPVELDTVLTDRYSTYYFNPRITVIVRNFANQKVYVGGEVNQPGMLPLTGELSALNAVLMAGGFRTSAQRSSVILLRKGEDGPQVMRVDLKDVLEGDAPDVALEPFDVVFVPRTFIYKANLFMQQYVRDLLPIATTANFSYILGNNVAILP